MQACGGGQADALEVRVLVLRLIRRHQIVVGIDGQVLAGLEVGDHALHVLLRVWVVLCCERDVRGVDQRLHVLAIDARAIRGLGDDRHGLWHRRFQLVVGVEPRLRQRGIGLRFAHRRSVQQRRWGRGRPGCDHPCVMEPVGSAEAPAPWRRRRAGRGRRSVRLKFHPAHRGRIRSTYAEPLLRSGDHAEFAADDLGERDDPRRRMHHGEIGRTVEAIGRGPPDAVGVDEEVLALESLGIAGRGKRCPMLDVDDIDVPGTIVPVELRSHDPRCRARNPGFDLGWGVALVASTAVVRLPALSPQADSRTRSPDISPIGIAWDRRWAGLRRPRSARGRWCATRAPDGPAPSSPSAPTGLRRSRRRSAARCRRTAALVRTPVLLVRWEVPRKRPPSALRSPGQPGPASVRLSTHPHPEPAHAHGPLPSVMCRCPASRTGQLNAGSAVIPVWQIGQPLADRMASGRW